MHVCFNKGCINRVSFGKEYDTDCVDIICIKCRRTYTKSAAGYVRLKNIRTISCVLLILFIGLMLFYPNKKLNPTQYNEGSQYEISGVYTALVNKHARSLQLLKISESDRYIIVKCDYIPLGKEYQSLNGTYDKKLNILNVDKIGVLTLIIDQGRYSLVSNELQATFYKS